MKFLLDTHTFIWFVEGSDKLAASLIDKIRSLENDCYISIASIWEIAIKMSADKLKLGIPFIALEETIDSLNLQILPINLNHINKLIELPYHHRDPFDRLIIAQSIVEDLTVISKDNNFSLYPAKILW